MRSIIIAVAIVAASVAQADIYKCVVNGKTTFSQQPCGDNAEVVKPRVVETSAQAVSQQQAVTESLKAASDRMAHDRRLADIERQLTDLDGAEAQTQQARDLEIRRLQATMMYANNNLAGATWQQSLATEMQAMHARFDSELRIIQSRRDALMRERERLLSTPAP
jgi:dTDP-D-glucose 4,6-dehydratase